MSSTEIVAINRIHRDPNRNDKIPKLGSSHPASASTFPSPEHSKELMLSKAFQKILKMYQLIWRTCIIASLLFGWGRTFHQNIQSKKNTNIIPIVLTKNQNTQAFTSIFWRVSLESCLEEWWAPISGFPEILLFSWRTNEKRPTAWLSKFGLY